MSRCRRTVAIAAIAIAGVASSGAVAAGSLRFTAGQLEFEGLAVEGLALDWVPDPADGAVTVRAARVRGLDATGPLARFAVDCPELRISGDELRCERGRLTGALGKLGMQDTAFTARRMADGSMQLDMGDFAVAGGRGKLGLSVQAGNWRMDANLSRLDLAKVAALAEPWVALPEDFVVSGGAAGQFRATGHGDTLAAARVALLVSGLEFSNVEGTLAGENVAGTLSFAATFPDAAPLRAHGRLTLDNGQAYSDPVFLDFAAHPVGLNFDGALDTDAARFDASSFIFDQTGVGRASGSATVDFAGETLLTAARVHLESLSLADALPAYVQPFLVDTAFRDVTGGGTVRGDVEVAEGLPVRAALELDGV